MATQQTIYIPRNDLSIFRSYTVEVPIGNVGVGSQNKFLLNEFLQSEGTGSVIYVGMECWTATQQTFSDSGRAIVTTVEAASLSVSLVWGQKALLYQQPYVSFIANSNFGMVRRLKDLRFSLSDSYAQVMGAGIAANKSALFTFYFLPVTKGR